MMSNPNSDPPELDLRVKGSLPSGASLSSTRLPYPQQQHRPPLRPSDPLETAPSSPSQIYLNLLILEASLRSQYLNHLARRRKFTFFLLVLFLWTVFFCYRFFVLGGSPYYYVSHLEKLGLASGVGTGVLYYAAGLYRTTIVEPRQFVFMANRGLKGFNVKLVKAPLSYREWISWWWGWYTFRPPPRQVSSATVRRRPSSNIRRPPPPVPSHIHAPSLSSMAKRLPGHPEEEGEEGVDMEDYLPGGLHLKLVILPKGFSPDFREGWELYRTEYWEKENEARLVRRREMKMRRHVKPEDISPVLAPAERRVRTSSISSQQVRTPTPEPDPRGTPPRRTRRGSATSVRRSVAGLPPRAVTPGDVSDSSTASAFGGERERARRSESVRTDRSSSSTGSIREQTRKPGGRGRGKKRTSKASEALMDEEEVGDRL